MPSKFAFILEDGEDSSTDSDSHSHMSADTHLPAQPRGGGAQRAGPVNDAVALHQRDRSASPLSTHSSQKVPVPDSLRSRFLLDSPQLPAQVLQHLERYIPPITKYPSFPPWKRYRAILDNGRAILDNDRNMDMGPDIYEPADDEPTETTPLIESSSAATERQNLAHANGHIDPDQIPSPSTPTTTSEEWYEDAAESGDPDLSNADPTWKSWTTTAVERRQQVVYTSAYTRSARDMCREVLEKYPARQQKKRWCCNVMDRLRAMWRSDPPP